MRINVSKPSSIFVENMSVELNKANPGVTLNKKTVALIYHFFMDHFVKNIVEVRKIISAVSEKCPMFCKYLRFSKSGFATFHLYLRKT